MHTLRLELAWALKHSLIHGVVEFNDVVCCLSSCVCVCSFPAENPFHLNLELCRPVCVTSACIPTMRIIYIGLLCSCNPSSAAAAAAIALALLLQLCLYRHYHRPVFLLMTKEQCSMTTVNSMSWIVWTRNAHTRTRTLTHLQACKLQHYSKDNNIHLYLHTQREQECLVKACNKVCVYLVATLENNT